MEKRWHAERITFHKKIKEYLILVLFIACAALLSLVMMDILVYPLALFSVTRSELFTTLVKHSIPGLLVIFILYKSIAVHYKFLQKKSTMVKTLLYIVLDCVVITGYITYAIATKAAVYTLFINYPILLSILIFILYKIISKLYTLIKEKHSTLLIIKSFFIHSGYTVLTMLILLHVIVPIVLVIYWIIATNYYQLDKITQ